MQEDSGMAASRTSGRSGNGRSRRAPAKPKTPTNRGTQGGDGLSGISEQLVNRIVKPLGLVLLSRERIREVLEESAEQGRITRHDAEDLYATLVQLGREQTEHLLTDLEKLLGRGRQGIDSATRRARTSESLDRLVRGADRARRSMGMGSSLPITGYDDMTVGQVQKRLGDLSTADLRKVREYERRHANRKSLLTAIDKALS
jgi:hypothetical protein